MKKELIITQAGLRLDRYLTDRLTDFSRSALHKLFDEGHIRVDQQVVKPSWKTQEGAHVVIHLPPEEASHLEAQAIALDVVYEDDALIIVNKPAGMVVHPAPGHRDQTLVNALLAHSAKLSDINGGVRPGIVHRLDKETSGLILAVKDNRVHQAMAQKIRRHEMTRVYQALVHGTVTAKSGTIEAPIGRDPGHRQRMAVVASGKPSLTTFERLQVSDRASLLQVTLVTGRTHQIRVHMHYIGHPVVGDPLYARGWPSYGYMGQMLHASLLSLKHPVSGEQLTVTCPLPPGFQEAMDLLL